MNPRTLKALTWGTVATALLSALLLAAAGAGMPDVDTAHEPPLGRPSTRYTADDEVHRQSGVNAAPGSQAGGSTTNSH